MCILNTTKSNLQCSQWAFPLVATHPSSRSPCPGRAGGGGGAGAGVGGRGCAGGRGRGAFLDTLVTALEKFEKSYVRTAISSDF